MTATPLPPNIFATSIRDCPSRVPQHYFPGDDPAREPVMVWRAHSSLLFSNWLNYFVYQETPFDLTKLVPHRRALQKQDARPSSERTD